MTHTYKITGMTCTGCQAKVQHLLEKVSGVTVVTINLEKGEASISMDNHISTDMLKSALKDYPKYQLTDKEEIKNVVSKKEETKTWLETYRPILMVFAYILGTTMFIEFTANSFNPMRWMANFMAGFFLVFSFFKLLNLKGFAESYAMYDIIAKQIKGWGYAYAFIELGLGISYLVGFITVVTNVITLVVMSVSIIGVLQSVLNKQKIKCACLGDVFNLPMSTITIIEDALMILMSAYMIFYKL